MNRVVEASEQVGYEQYLFSSQVSAPLFKREQKPGISKIPTVFTQAFEEEVDQTPQWQIDSPYLPRREQIGTIRSSGNVIIPVEGVVKGRTLQQIIFSDGVVKYRQVIYTENDPTNTLLQGISGKVKKGLDQGVEKAFYQEGNESDAAQYHYSEVLPPLIMEEPHFKPGSSLPFTAVLFER